jgi:hypothetical protein
MSGTQRSGQPSRRVVLHVGPPKTATTTIQTALRLGGDFICPEPGPGSGHTELARRSIGLGGFVAEPQMLVDLVSDLDRDSPPGLPVVISSETFAYTVAKASRADALRRLALRFRTELVITIRRDDERVAALAAQAIVAGNPLDPARCWTSIMNRDDLQPNLVLRFLEAAPWSAAHVVRVESADPEHLFVAFEHIIGAPIQRVAPKNTRWPTTALAVMNELNHVGHPDVPLAKRREIARRDAQMMGHTDPAALRYALPPVPEEVLTLLRDRWFAELGEIRALAAIGRLRLHESIEGPRRPAKVDDRPAPHIPVGPAEVDAEAADRPHRGARRASGPSSDRRSDPSDARPQGLILHVGPPKTGTSALQVFLAQNSQALKRLGLLYPRLDAFDVGEQGGVASGNGFTLASLLTGLASVEGSELVERTQAVERLLVRLKAELSAGPGLRGAVLSSEYLTRPSTDDLRRFRSLASSVFDDVCAISVHRDPIELLCSDHGQATKGDPGLQQTLEEFWADRGPQVLARRLRTPIRYADAFGDPAVAVVRYDGSGATGQQLVRDFLQAATGLERSEIERFLASEDVLLLQRPVNRSLGPIGGELVRLCNVNGVDRGTVRRLYTEIDRVTPELAPALPVLSELFRKDVTDATRAIVDELATRFRIEGLGTPPRQDSVRARTDSTDSTDVTRMHPEDELRWVLEGVARTLASPRIVDVQPLPALRAALTRFASRSREARKVSLVRRVRRSAASRRVAALLPDGIRSALNRLMDRHA